MKHLINYRLNCLFVFLLFFSCDIIHKHNPSKEYSELNKRLAQGWNTWNTRSVLSHVLLPQSFAINLQLQNRLTNEILREALIGRRGAGVENVIPGAHSYDGSYTDLKVEWKSEEISVESASEGNNLTLKISPVKNPCNIDLLINPKVLWGKQGNLKIDKYGIHFNKDTSNINIYINGSYNVVSDSLIRCRLTHTLYLSTFVNKKDSALEHIILEAGVKQLNNKSKYKSDSVLYDAMETVLAWNIIYDPIHERVIAPVSRLWNCNWKGWILFDWDTYFSSYMFAIDNKDMAYANSLAITKEISEKGFIPNFGSGYYKSEDRSQPPVGSTIIKEIYKKYPEKWYLREVFDDLLKWNRWWENNRDYMGYLCWGSNPYTDENIKKFPPQIKNPIGKKVAALWESGLDNSPMYDEAVFDTTRHLLLLADVGLMSLYIADCKNLAEIAGILGKTAIEKELLLRGEKYSKNLQTLWNEKFGLFLNKDLVTGKFSYRLSPTLFYPLLAKLPGQLQANRMINEHFYNPGEFWGEWTMPSIAFNDNAFKDNNYWRGRIWAPMNFLVYLGMRNYDLQHSIKDLKEKSFKLILKSWNEEKHVYENYNAISGKGDDVGSSDKFYHWGALLGYISLLDDGYYLPNK